ncbi:MAG: TIGR04086 family membrane protein [Clostridia bacterium]|nr:TIGR04086 family membrane protein [Clostridia bacterium]
MKEKLKKINLSEITPILKVSLIGVVVSILLVLLFAFVLKFVDLSSGTISLIDQIIKVLSILVAIVVLNKQDGNGLLVKSLITGAIYSVITFIVFSILNGGINFSVAILTDIIFSALVGGVCAILLNIIKKK